MPDRSTPSLVVTVVLLAALAEACGAAGGGTAGDGEAGGAAGGDSGVVWNDPSGDVGRFTNLPDLPRPGVSRVRVESANGELLVVLTTSSLAEVLAYRAPDGKIRGATLAGLYLDTDNDPSTGGAPFVRSSEDLAGRRGYDR